MNRAAVAIGGREGITGLVYLTSGCFCDTTLKEDEIIVQATELRQSKYLNNLVEQDHRNIKRIVKPMMGVKTFNSARRTLSGLEAMNMIRKGQVNSIDRGDIVSQVKLIEVLFGVAA
ncbi:DDE-type integrase/transposase/recombinase [Leptolyngbya sp. ST-U4]|uniref:DDE-type integrase/transposase/recombinase n=1 Tax=Leptolyngbya sp. ST-U4 TaxID=2933912 RepID=UPI00329A1C43